MAIKDTKFRNGARTLKLGERGRQRKLEFTGYGLKWMSLEGISRGEIMGKVAGIGWPINEEAVEKICREYNLIKGIDYNFEIAFRLSPAYSPRGWRGKR